MRLALPCALFVSSLLVAACSGTHDASTGVGAPDGGGPPSGEGPDGAAVDGASGDAAPPPAASCAIATKGTAGLLVRATLLAPSGPMKGELLVDVGGKITCVDASCASAPGYAAATVLACPDGVVSAALINGHDHTEYNAAPPLPHGTERWQHRNGWRTGAGGETALPKVKSTTDAAIIAAAELRFVLGGATTINGSGGVAGLARNAAAARSNAAQLEGLTSAVFFDTFPLGDSNGAEIVAGCGYPSIRTAASAFASGAYSPHIGEGVNAAAENELTCLKASLVTSETAIIHAVGVDATDVDVIAKAGAKVIWSARTNVDLYGNTAPVTLLKNAGVTIGLGTDWLASGSMNMLRELSCVDSLNQKYFAKAFDDRTLVEMATKNAAVALKIDGQLGELSVGKLADIAIWNGVVSKEYRAVIDAGVEDVLLLLKNGKPLYGEASIVDALQPGCGDLAACGTQKKVCVDTGNVTWAQIQAAAQSTYPLFFCKGHAPDAEPSCIPYRDTYPNGTSATDRDGDGIADAQDDCPDVFNPTRPMDGATQSDVDKDGAGDACDAKPLDPAAH
jgi:Amidohydrolase family